MHQNNISNEITGIKTLLISVQHHALIALTAQFLNCLFIIVKLHQSDYSTSFIFIHKKLEMPTKRSCVLMTLKNKAFEKGEDAGCRI